MISDDKSVVLTCYITYCINIIFNMVITNMLILNTLCLKNVHGSHFKALMIKISYLSLSNAPCEVDPKNKTKDRSN